MSKNKEATIGLKEQFLAAEALKPTTVTVTDWSKYAAANSGPELAHFANETPARDQAEQIKINQLQGLVAGTNGLRDVRDFSLVARSLFPEPDYLVGAGSSHIWICRVSDQCRVGIVYHVLDGRTFRNHDEPHPNQNKQS